MSLRRYILGTVTANLALVGALLWQAARMPAAGVRSSAGTTPHVVPEVSVEPSPRPAVVPVPAAPFRWEAVEATNHLQFLTNILAIGCPPETARDILDARVADDYRARLRELMRPLQAHFWEASAAGVKLEKLVAEPALEQQVAELKAERKRLRAELDAQIPRAKPASIVSADPKRAHLSPARLAELKALERQLAATRAEVEEGFATVPFREVGRKQTELAEQEVAQRRALLTEAEWMEFELRANPQVARVRELRGYPATAEDFRALVMALRESDSTNPKPSTHPSHPADHPEFLARLRTHESQRKTFLTAQLGEAGFAAFERGSDPRFHTLLKLARRLDLPSANAVQWLELQSAAQDQARLLRANTGVEEQARAAALLAIRAETERTLRNAVGARGWGAYQREAGDWLKQLSE